MKKFFGDPGGDFASTSPRAAAYFLYTSKMTHSQKFFKRGFDISFSLIALVLFSPLILVGYAIACLSTGKNGFFKQQRVGRGGKLFSIIKLRTMLDIPGISTTATTKSDPRITKGGAFLRESKIDELPQLWNVFTGQMSFVGPRPDVPGFADKVSGEDQIILAVRPGLTGPAAIKFKNEEELLAAADDPEKYNREILWPDKVRINREYVENYSFCKDIYYLFKTIIP